MGGVQSQAAVASAHCCNPKLTQYILTNKKTLSVLVETHDLKGSKDYADEGFGYKARLFDLETVKYSVGEDVRDVTYTNGTKDFLGTHQVRVLRHFQQKKTIEGC